MYDIVYPLKEQKINHDLRYALRSLDKFGAEVGKVVIVGYKPAWITNVMQDVLDSTAGLEKTSQINPNMSFNDA